MENKINIAEILRDMPKGTKLYSPIFGDTVLEYVDSDDKYPIIVTLSDGSSEKFSPHGIYFAKFEDGKIFAWTSGVTSFSSESSDSITWWMKGKLAEDIV